MGSAFAQCFNELWPNDCNFTIGSFLCLFLSPEKEQIKESRVFFEFEPQNAFFQQILQGSSHCLNALKPMDYCVKDNKNHHLLAFLSLLIARKVFEEVRLGFLVVGHTHGDIDGSFRYLLKKLREQNNYVIVDLMKAFMFSQNRPFISQLIQKIPNFKSWANGYLSNGSNVLVNHMQMHLFQ